MVLYKFKKFIFNLIIIALIGALSFAPVSVFAADDDFIGNPSKWLSSEYDIKTDKLEALEGYYQYYVDCDMKTIYFHISYNIKDLNEYSDVKVGAVIDNNLNCYDIEFCPGYTDEIDSLKLSSNFSNISQNGQEVFFSVEFRNKNDVKLVNGISVTVLINNVVYLACNPFEFSFDVGEGADLSTVNNNDKNTANNKTSTTKRVNSVSSTKFKPSYNYNAENTTKFSQYHDNETECYYEESISNAADAGQVAVRSDSNSKVLFSEESKIGIIISLIFLVLGILITAKSIYSKHIVKIADEDSEE